MESEDDSDTDSNSSDDSDSEDTEYDDKSEDDEMDDLISTGVNQRPSPGVYTSDAKSCALLDVEGASVYETLMPQQRFKHLRRNSIQIMAALAALRAAGMLVWEMMMWKARSVPMLRVMMRESQGAGSMATGTTARKGQFMATPPLR